MLVKIQPLIRIIKVLYNDFKAFSKTENSKLLRK